MKFGSACHAIASRSSTHDRTRWFSDKIYWQVADQPGKEGPDSLVMVDSEDKEVKKGLSSLNQQRK